MKLGYEFSKEKDLVTFEWGQRDLTFVNTKTNEIKIEFCDGNETDKSGSMFRRYLYVSIDEQKALKKLLKRNINAHK